MQKSIEIKSRGLTLRGMLHIPDNTSRKLPLIIILHGFGGNKMGPHFMFVRLSRALEELGFASIRFDFAGSGESDGEFINMTLSGELEDAINILNYSKALSFVDTGKIGLLGFSMGGAVASMLAGIRGQDIRSLCLWSPAGNIAEIVTDDFIGSGYEDFVENGYHEFEGLPIGKAFVDDIRKIDIYDIASRYQRNILLLHGSADEVVSLKASKEYLEYYNERAELIIIEEADHMFSREHWVLQLIKLTNEFFIHELAGSLQAEYAVIY